MVILVSISCCRCRCCCCCYFRTWLVIISAVRLSINRPKFSRSLNNNNNNKKGGNSERVRHIFHFDKQASLPVWMIARKVNAEHRAHGTMRMRMWMWRMAYLRIGYIGSLLTKYPTRKKNSDISSLPEWGGQNVSNSLRADHFLLLLLLDSYRHHRHHQFCCSISSLLLLFLANACDGFEPHNERMKETSKHLTKQMHTPSNSKEKERKNEMKTLLSAYLVARVRFTQRNCFGSYDVWGLFLARSSPVARFIKHSTFKLCASVSVCVSKSNFSFGYYESQTFFRNTRTFSSFGICVRYIFSPFRPYLLAFQQCHRQRPCASSTHTYRAHRKIYVLGFIYFLSQRFF